MPAAITATYVQNIVRTAGNVAASPVGKTSA